MTNAEYFIAHNLRGVTDLTVLRRLAQEAGKLVSAALELPCYGDIRKERRAERELVAALGRIQAMVEIAVERLDLDGKAIATSRNKLSKAWALEIDPDWRCASDDDQT